MRRRRLRVACPERDTDVAGGLSWVSVSNAFSRVAFRCLVMKGSAEWSLSADTAVMLLSE